jgi:hypothetical protein
VLKHALQTLSALAIGFASMAQAQTGADCPVKHKLSLEQVAGFIERKVPEERTVGLIESCHVSFSLNAAALERLIAAGVSGDELQALNRETLELLTVEEAHVEVGGLEQHIADSNKAMDAERDAALEKLNAEFQAQRARAAHMEPRGEFETTQEFNVRKQQTEHAVAALERKHDEDSSGLTAICLAKANTKAQPYQARIAYLEQSVYADPARAAYLRYNPDQQELTAAIAGEEYLFQAVPPASARQLVQNWKNVTLARPFREDEAKSRLLRLPAAQIAIKGQSRAALDAAKAAVIKTKLDEAAHQIARKDFDGALRTYQEVLALDPGNKAAKNAVEAEQRRRADRQRDIQVAADKLARDPKLIQGTWFDRETRLLWIDKDNGRGVIWEAAGSYCSALRVGDFSGWRLPTLDELEGIYDASKNHAKMSGKKAWDWLNSTQPSSTVLPGLSSYHIKGDIRLSNPLLWSSTISSPNSGQAMVVYFDAGKKGPAPIEMKEPRVLCVRAVSDAELPSRLLPGRGSTE